MLEFLLVFLVTLIVITTSVLLHLRLSVPRYRIERADLRELLEQAIDGRAEPRRWDLVTGISIRHDEQLAEWQQRCRAIGEKMSTRNTLHGASSCSFPPEAVEAMKRILLEMDISGHNRVERRF